MSCLKSLFTIYTWKCLLWCSCYFFCCGLFWSPRTGCFVTETIRTCSILLLYCVCFAFIINLIKIRFPHLLPLFHRLFCSRREWIYEIINQHFNILNRNLKINHRACVQGIVTTQSCCASLSTCFDLKIIFCLKDGWNNWREESGHHRIKARAHISIN